MNKKIFFILGALVFFSSFFVFTPSIKSANWKILDGSVTPNTPLVSPNSDGTFNINFNGIFTDSGVKLLANNHFYLYYQLVSTTKDITKINIQNTGTSITSCNIIPPANNLQATWSCGISNISSGLYGWVFSAGGSTALMQNQAVDVSNTGVNNNKNNSIVINNNESYQIDNGPPQVLSDSSAVNISVKIINPSDGLYQIGLGTTTDNGKTCNQIQVGRQFNPNYNGNSPNGGLRVTTDSTGKITSAIITETFRNTSGGTLAPGVYCTLLNAGALGQNMTNVVSSFGSSGMFIIRSSNVVGTTTTQTDPNAYGCTSNGTDTYCMLAPLPIPDASGNINNRGEINVRQGMSTYILGLITLFMGIIGVLAVLMIVVGGIEYMSTVNVGEKEGAKDRMINAILGLILALGSYTILKTINPNLVDLHITVPGAQLVLDMSLFGNSELDSSPINQQSLNPKALTDKGFNCPGNGGPTAIPGIVSSFQGRVTYRFGGGHAGPPYLKETKQCPANSGKMCRDFCPDGQLCLDCSAFANTILMCAGITSDAGSGTYELFKNKGEPIDPKASKAPNIINGYPLRDGDLVGWKEGDNGQGYGHVFVFSNNSLYDSHSGKNDSGRASGGATEGAPFDFGTYLPKLTYVYRASPIIP